MKKSIKPSLRAKSLDTSDLVKVAGGRGSYCGGTMHCECGYVADVWSFCINIPECGVSINMCPSCYADPWA
jgi:hypothetical protein